MSVPMKPDDPAYWMLQQGLNDPGKRSKPVIYRSGCYICEDSEFALMGMPLCYICKFCPGHVPADDCVCTDCGKDQHEGNCWDD